MRMSTLLQPRRRVDHDDLWYALLGVWLIAMLVGGGGLWRTKLTPAAIDIDGHEARRFVASCELLAADDVGEQRRSQARCVTGTPMRTP
jgi:hypothetical protein